VAVAITSTACSLAVDTSGLSGPPDAGNAGSSPADAGTSPGDAPPGGDAAPDPAAAADGGADAKTDAAAPARCTRATNELFCEDFDRGFAVANLTCSPHGRARITSSHASSAPSALEIVATGPVGQCYADRDYPGVTTAVELSFRVRLEALGGRIHLFNLGIDSGTPGRPFLYVNVFPGFVALGEARRRGDDYEYTEGSLRSAPPVFGRWIEGVLTLDSLASDPRVTFVFDGVTLADRRALSSEWKAGIVHFTLGLVTTEMTATFALDDVRVRRGP
jgi:hypothetical protein